MVIVRLSMFISFLPVVNPNLVRFCITIHLMNIILGLTVELTATPSVQVMLEKISLHALNYSPIHCIVLESLADLLHQSSICWNHLPITVSVTNYLVLINGNTLYCSN